MREKSEPRPLFRPAQGHSVTQLSQTEVGGLPSIEDGFHDVGRKEGALQNLSYVAFIEAGLASQRSSAPDPSRNNLRIPVVASGHGFDQRRNRNVPNKRSTPDLEAPTAKRSQLFSTLLAVPLAGEDRRFRRTPRSQRLRVPRPIPSAGRRRKLTRGM